MEMLKIKFFSWNHISFQPIHFYGKKILKKSSLLRGGLKSLISLTRKEPIFFYILKLLKIEKNVSQKPFYLSTSPKKVMGFGRWTFFGPKIFSKKNLQKGKSSWKRKWKSSENVLNREKKHCFFQLGPPQKRPKKFKIKSKFSFIFFL